jgi:hypothetical protein
MLHTPVSVDAMPAGCAHRAARPRAHACVCSADATRTHVHATPAAAAAACPTPNARISRGTARVAGASAAAPQTCTRARRKTAGSSHRWAAAPSCTPCRWAGRARSRPPGTGTCLQAEAAQRARWHAWHAQGRATRALPWLAQGSATRACACAKRQAWKLGARGPVRRTSSQRNTPAPPPKKPDTHTHAHEPVAAVSWQPGGHSSWGFA